jgi:hypothetical protein
LKPNGTWLGRKVKIRCVSSSSFKWKSL